MRKLKEYYDKVMKEGDDAVYSSGVYKIRNDMIIDWCEGDDLRIIDIAGGSTYMARQFLRRKQVSRYTLVDFSRVVGNAAAAIKDKRFAYMCADVEAADVDFSPFNTFFFVSMEHIEYDLALIDRVPAGSRIAVCSPSFADPAHVRVFYQRNDFIARYDKYMTKEVKCSIPVDGVGHKYLLCGRKY